MFLMCETSSEIILFSSNQPGTRASQQKAGTLSDEQWDNLLHSVLKHRPLVLPAELLQDPYRHSGGLRSLRKPGIPCKFTEAPCLPCSVSARSLMTKFAFPLCIGSSCKVLCSFQWVKFPGSSPSDSCQYSMPPATIKLGALCSSPCG